MTMAVNFIGFKVDIVGMHAPRQVDGRAGYRIIGVSVPMIEGGNTLKDMVMAVIDRSG
ncbi:methionine synthase II [Moorella thermoacetica Y72]|uniref:Methionine synthase II n=1 Tax=Moorella thermoacetica Y72 TaxID=1325331 RepID=A0A0S6UC23_NEOTH|nr:methionine synthase II [Moorella thermoacetica Y72]